MRTALYRHWDASDALLWVGVAANPIQRLGSHSCNTPWFRDIAKITVEWHDTRDGALEAETTAILSERPRFNIKASNRGHRRPFGPRRVWPTALGDWLAANDVTLADMALRVGVGTSHMSQLAQGKSVPGRPLAALIERETQGAVPASSWTAPATIAA